MLVTCRRCRRENHGIHLAIFDGEWNKSKDDEEPLVYPSYLCRHESDTDLLHTAQSFLVQSVQEEFGDTRFREIRERYEISFVQSGTYRPRRIFHALNRCSRSFVFAELASLPIEQDSMKSIPIAFHHRSRDRDESI